LPHSPSSHAEAATLFSSSCAPQASREQPASVGAAKPRTRKTTNTLSWRMDAAALARGRRGLTEPPLRTREGDRNQCSIRRRSWSRASTWGFSSAMVALLFRAGSRKRIAGLSPRFGVPSTNKRLPANHLASPASRNPAGMLPLATRSILSEQHPGVVSIALSATSPSLH